MRTGKKKHGSNNFSSGEEENFLFDDPRRSLDDSEEDEEGNDLAEIDVLDLSGDAIHEVLPYLEQCEREGRTLADIINEFWEAVSEE